MQPIVHSIEIDRPPEEVFSYITDPTRFAEWQYDVESVRIDDERPPSVGSRFTTIRRIGRAERAMTQEITEINPPTSWAAHGVAGPIRPSANITVEPLNDSTRSCEDRTRLQRTRDRRAARTRHPPDRSEGGA
jgi:uncharacterized protein YndB with AHSA1/START domain